jgi:AcrR family transcriptional regulator
LQATRYLLVESGYSGVSLDRVATQAGVGKQSVYRRWQAKGPLVAAALAEAYADQADALAMPDTGDIAEDLRSWLHGLAVFESAPESTALLRALAASAAENVHDNDELYEQITGLQHQRLVDRLQSAIAAGEIRSDVDPGAVADALLGISLFRALTEQRPLDETIARFDSLLDVLINGLRHQ